LSPPPASTLTHSEWRGDFPSLSRAPASSAGNAWAKSPKAKQALARKTTHNFFIASTPSMFIKYTDKRLRKDYFFYNL
jgi:hypothetical protein